MKFPKLAALALLSMQAAADPRLDCKTRSDAANVLTDVIVVRPVGAVGTLAGAALFVGLSPLTALAAIPEPHDAFHKLGGILVGVPYAYTFVRPLGYFSNTCD
ncbi:MAG: hypothetical protein ACKN9T_06410 [Candidatus Methylumidiphilus sp.]